MARNDKPADFLRRPRHRPAIEPDSISVLQEIVPEALDLDVLRGFEETGQTVPFGAAASRQCGSRSLRPEVLVPWRLHRLEGTPDAAISETAQIGQPIRFQQGPQNLPRGSGCGEYEHR